MSKTAMDAKFRKQKHFGPHIVDTVKKINGHQCDLHVEDSKINFQINSGWCVEFRRYLWKLRRINANHPDSKRYFLSTAKIYEEESRHMNYYPCIIYPFSTIVYGWHFVMIFVWGLDLILIPVPLASLNEDVHNTYMTLKTVLNFVCLLDILLHFSTGFYCKKQNRVILKSNIIVKRYISSYFVTDVIAAVPFQMVGFFPESEWYHIKLLMLLRLVRVPTFFRYIQKYCQQNEALKRYFPFFFLMALVLLATHFATGLTYYFKHIFPEEELDTIASPSMASNFLLTQIRFVRRFLLVQLHDEANTAESIIFKSFEILCLMLGAALHIVLIARLMEILHKESTSTMKYDNLVEEISEYMKYKELPATLKDKVLNYIELKFRQRIFREEDIALTLSENLKDEMLHQSCKQMVENLPLFKNLPKQAILRIVNKLKSEIYLPNDVIVCAGYSGNSMYFIYIGTVAVYTGSGTEICHLKDGAHFGEVALLTNAPRVATVIAVKGCELLKLTRRDFQEAIEPFPDLVKQMRDSAYARIENTMHIMQENRSSLESSQLIYLEEEYSQFMRKNPSSPE